MNSNNVQSTTEATEADLVDFVPHRDLTRHGALHSPIAVITKMQRASEDNYKLFFGLGYHIWWSLTLMISTTITAHCLFSLYEKRIFTDSSWTIMTVIPFVLAILAFVPGYITDKWYYARDVYPIALFLGTLTHDLIS